MKRESKTILFWILTMVTAGMFTITYNNTYNPIINKLTLIMFVVCTALYTYNYIKYRNDTNKPQQ